MASKLVVLLQFAALAVLASPWNAAGWNPWAWLPILLAVALTGWTFAHNPPGNFSIFPEPRAHARLVTSGPYARVRHPLYLALIVLALALCIGWNTMVHWLAAAALVLILDVKARREERLLRARFGEYDAYAARTSRLVPGRRGAAR